ncbi:winged helix-turn-helix transcriptional regulator [Streptomyces sp. YC504]|uniref:Winged helix-turn-helix transcriptional regulator n=1 Tax=Streptomyces mesophilus TaxID=1775132 RepID=A0A6G4XIR1_9ACTN|nr:winged helix-turn-helix domain-containing protein [Streptomyces mesophilus]NGO76730.1 winged helix-turn-helix transcriptional regulator [Streptomyces mesophilus]
MAEPKKDPKVRDLDPRSLRGLAHPLRMQLLDALQHFGPATASQLAERLGESSGATSYHLRQLATHGFVEDDPDRGKGRERWWRAVHLGTRSNHQLIDDPDPAVRGAANTMLQFMADKHYRELTTYLGVLREEPDEWRGASNLSNWSLHLTPELAEEMNDKLMEVIASYKRAVPGGRAPGERSYRVHLHAFPLTDEGDDSQ